MRKPYFRKDRGAWFVKTPNGRSQIRLHEDQSTAFKIWGELCAVAHPEAIDSTMAAIAENFLRHAKANVAAKTYRGYSDALVSFCNRHGRRKVRELKPYDVTRWLDGKPTWGKWARHGAVAAVKRCLNWAVAEGYLATNPITWVRTAKGGRREVLIEDDVHGAMMRAEDCGRRPGRRIELLGRKPVRRDACFRQVLIALKHSGARPGSIAAVRIEDMAPDGSAWIIHQHKTRGKTGAALIIYLSPCLQTLTRIAAAGRTSGPLFLNSRGQAWTSNAIRCRMTKLREKCGLPSGTVAYAYRHSYATRALVNGTDVATVAELLGHTDIKMIAQNYGHLDLHKEHLKRAAARAVRS